MRYIVAVMGVITLALIIITAMNVISSHEQLRYQQHHTRSGETHGGVIHKVSNARDKAVLERNLTFFGTPVIMYDAYYTEFDPRPAIMFIHGGGWIAGSPVLPLDIPLVTELGAVVFSTTYRLAPKNLFPTQIDDCFYALKYLYMHAQDFNIDPARITLMGGSAGGNLVASLSFAMSQPPVVDQFPKLHSQILVSPLLQAVDFNTPSYQANNSDVSGIGREYMIRFWTMYARGRDEDLRKKLVRNALIPPNVGAFFEKRGLNHALIPDELKPSFYRPNNYSTYDEPMWDGIKGTFLNPRFAPLMASSFKGLPPTFIYVAEQDVIRDDALLYEQALRKYGILVERVLEHKGYHGSFWDPKNKDIFKKLAKFIDNV